MNKRKVSDENRHIRNIIYWRWNGMDRYLIGGIDHLIKALVIFMTIEDYQLKKPSKDINKAVDKKNVVIVPRFIGYIVRRYNAY